MAKTIKVFYGDDPIELPATHYWEIGIVVILHVWRNLRRDGVPTMQAYRKTADELGGSWETIRQIVCAHTTQEERTGWQYAKQTG